MPPCNENEIDSHRCELPGKARPRALGRASDDGPWSEPRSERRPVERQPVERARHFASFNAATRALAASIPRKIPVVFPAVSIDGVFHVDGGLSNNLPVEPFSDRKGEVVVMEGHTDTHDVIDSRP